MKADRRTITISSYVIVAIPIQWHTYSEDGKYVDKRPKTWISE